MVALGQKARYRTSMIPKGVHHPEPVVQFLCFANRLPTTQPLEPLGELLAATDIPFPDHQGSVNLNGHALQQRVDAVLPELLETGLACRTESGTLLSPKGRRYANYFSLMRVLELDRKAIVEGLIAGYLEGTSQPELDKTSLCIEPRFESALRFIEYLAVHGTDLMGQARLEYSHLSHFLVHFDGPGESIVDRWCARASCMVRVNPSGVECRCRPLDDYEDFGWRLWDLLDVLRVVANQAPDQPGTRE